MKKFLKLISYFHFKRIHYFKTTVFDIVKFNRVTFCFLTLITVFSIHARVGEEKSALEIRLFRGGGIQYKKEQAIDRLQKGMPYLKFEKYFPSSCIVRLYFKTLDGRRPKPSEVENPQNLEGWDVHVIYYKEISMLEIYEKNQPISEFEMIHLLNLQSGDSFWQKTKLNDPEEKVPASSFGFDMIRDDQKIRAKRINASTLMFFSTDFDEGLARAKKDDLEEKAPDSVYGF